VPAAHLHIDCVDSAPEIVELRAKLICSAVNVLGQCIAWAGGKARDVFKVKRLWGIVGLWQARTRHAGGIGWPVQRGHWNDHAEQASVAIYVYYS